MNVNKYHLGFRRISCLELLLDRGAYPSADQDIIYAEKSYIKLLGISKTFIFDFENPFGKLQKHCIIDYEEALLKWRVGSPDIFCYIRFRTLVSQILTIASMRRFIYLLRYNDSTCMDDFPGHHKDVNNFSGRSSKLDA